MYFKVENSLMSFGQSAAVRYSDRKLSTGLTNAVFIAW
jgi:hypothetical protein